MKLDSRKKSRRDRIMRSKSFETQELREIDWKEAGESSGAPILWIGIIKDVFQMEEKKVKTRKDCVGENQCQSEEGAFARNRQPTQLKRRDPIKMFCESLGSSGTQLGWHEMASL